MCSLSLSLSLSPHELSAQCPDYDLSFSAPIQVGGLYRVDVNIDLTGTGQFYLVGASLVVNVTPASGLVVDQSMTTASSNLPPTVNFQYDINSTGTSIVAYGDGSSPFVLLNGSMVAFSIYFSGDPGNCYSVSFAPSAPQSIKVIDIQTSNSTYCSPDNIGALVQQCLPALMISGKVYKVPPMGQCIASVDYGVPEVKINIDVQDPPPATAYDPLTAVNGSYMQEISASFLGEDVLIKPAYNDYLACGLTILDDDMIRTYILGSGPNYCMNYNWQLIAADLSGDGSISTYDRSILNKILLGIPLNITVPAWKFVNSSQYSTASPACGAPPQYDEFRLLSNFSQSAVLQEFLAIKIGDVDGSCTNCTADPQYFLVDPNSENALNRESSTIDIGYTESINSSGQRIVQFKNADAFFPGSMMWTFQIDGAIVEDGYYEWPIGITSKMLVNVQSGQIRCVLESDDQYDSPFGQGTTLLELPLNTDYEYLKVLPESGDYVNAYVLYGKERAVQFYPRALDNRINVFPNPASGQIRIVSNEQVLATITSMSGVRIGEYFLQVGENILDASIMPPGMYVIQVGDVVEKLIIK